MKLKRIDILLGVISFLLEVAIENRYFDFDSVTNFAQQVAPNDASISWALHTLVFIVSAGGIFTALHYLFVRGENTSQ